MTTRFFQTDDKITPSLAMKDDLLYYSHSKIKTESDLEKEILKEGFKITTRNIALDKIIKIKFNEKNEAIKIYYSNDKGKEKTKLFRFASDADTNEFGHILGDAAHLQRSEIIENRLKTIFIQGALFFGIAALTLYLIPTENFQDFIESKSSSTRSGQKSEIVKILFSSIGHMGSILTGTACAGGLLYSMLKRFKNPASDVLYN